MNKYFFVEAASTLPDVNDAYTAGYTYEDSIYDWISDWFQEPLIYAMMHGKKVLGNEIFTAFEEGRRVKAKEVGHKRRYRIDTGANMSTIADRVVQRRKRW